MKLKKKFKFSDSNQIWRIKITDKDKLFVETRDTKKLKAYFHCYDLFTGKKIFSKHQMSEKFWLGIEAIKEDIVFFHRFAKPDMPGHRGIIAFDINSQKVIWEHETYAFLFIYNDLIYVYQERFEGRGFYTLNISSGKVVDELGENHDEINLLREEAENSIDYSDYSFPEKFIGSSSDEPADLLISNEIKDYNITGDIEYVNSGELLLFNYHKSGTAKDYINIFKAFNLSNNKEIVSEVLNRSANAFAPDSFFVFKNLIILLKEKREIIVLEIKK